jgi:dipeptidyl aminopeptidase/acylaminoacyl peptidase
VTELGRASLSHILPAPAGSADWEDVLSRARASHDSRRRHLVAVAAAALVVAVGTASAFAFLLGVNRTAYDASPVWLPDGRRIAFISNRDGSGEVHVLNADGSGRRNLTRELGLAGFPVWSPDGRKIAFRNNTCARRRPPCNGTTEIYVLNADGSGKQRLARGVSVKHAWTGQLVYEQDQDPA